MDSFERIRKRIEQSISKIEIVYGKKVKQEAQDLLFKRDYFKMIDFCDKYINKLYN